MKIKLKESFKSYFPKNLYKWKIYLRNSLPIMLASFVFALNAFVDNFMSINIEGGNQALSYANSWTEIQIGIISLTTIVGSSLFAQYFGSRNIEKLKEVINFRILFALFIALIFAIPCIAITGQMVDLISGFDKNMLSIVRNNSIIYLRLITISWLLNAIAFTVAMILREKHHSIVSFIGSAICLVLNIILNSIFIFGIGLGIEFLAISTIISIGISLLFCIGFIFFKDKEILINPLKIFKISTVIWKQFGKRIWSFLLLAVGSLMVNIRFIFWNIGYPTGSIGDGLYVLSAANILGITGMFFNIFWTTFESINANIAIYVGKKLGSNEFELAKENAKELQGFHTIVAIVLGLSLFALSFAIEQMTFLADGYKQSLISSLKNKSMTQEQIDSIVANATNMFMENLKYTLWPLCIFMPMFIWFISRSRVLSAGGLTNVVSIVEAIVGAIQIGWLCLICLVMNKNNTLSFPWAYSIFFFLSDIPKFILYEVLYFKLDWVKNITSEIEIKYS